MSTGTAEDNGSNGAEILIHDVATGNVAEGDAAPALVVVRVDTERETVSSETQPVDPRAALPRVAVATFSGFGFGLGGLLGGVAIELEAGDVDLPKHSTCTGASAEAPESPTTTLPPIPAVGVAHELLMLARPLR